jgi:hypothetical protein
MWKQLFGDGQARADAQTGFPVVSQGGQAGVEFGTTRSRSAQAATVVPASVNEDPWGVRVINRIPVWDSIVASRAETACWLTPTRLAAALRLPACATARKTSRAARSGMRALNVMPPR